MKKLILLTLLTSGAAFAAPQSSDVPLPGGGQIAPRQTVQISAQPLIKDVNYIVTCTLNNPNNDGIAMKTNVWASIDGKKEGGYQFLLNPGDHSVSTPFVYNPGYHSIDFTNLDSTEVVSVNNCVGKVAVKK